MKSFAEYRELEEAHQVVAKTKQGETLRSAVYPTKEKALSMHYKMAKSGKYKSVETVPVKEEVDQLEEMTQVKEETVQEASELGDLAHQKTMKHRFLVTYSDPNHTSTSMRKEKQQKHVLVPGTKNGESVYKGDAEPLVKKYMNKQGYKVHDVEHVGMVSKKVN